MHSIDWLFQKALKLERFGAREHSLGRALGDKTPCSPGGHKRCGIAALPAIAVVQKNWLELVIYLSLVCGWRTVTFQLSASTVVGACPSHCRPVFLRDLPLELLL